MRRLLAVALLFAPLRATAEDELPIEERTLSRPAVEVGVGIGSDGPAIAVVRAGWTWGRVKVGGDWLEDGGTIYRALAATTDFDEVGLAGTVTFGALSTTWIVGAALDVGVDARLTDGPTIGPTVVLR